MEAQEARQSSKKLCAALGDGRILSGSWVGLQGGGSKGLL